MQPLDRTLRRQLENRVKEAREVAEAAARAAIDHLGVAEGKPPAHLSPTEKELRRRLRTHGRQLGDERHAKSETQETERLVEEVAYEHWHRMLFARFLAENNLLMYPDPDDPVAVTLAECDELAAEEGAKNGWDLAARFAAKMLPQIFRPDSPVFEFLLPPERQQELERLLVGLPKEVFQASDSLGWVYQFWQAKRKDEVNASEVKIGARELPAVTQLFTEPYMVAFLLDNTLGAWWAGQTLTADDFRNAKSEDELRQKAALPEMPLEYLRFVQEEGVWRPAAGTLPGWPNSLAELTILDPCCGSGHFLVAALPMLASMRMAKDGLSARDAVDAVLRENLHGLEIDQRCVELAAFATALAAWRFPGAGEFRRLPELNIACSGLSIGIPKDEWIRFAAGNANLRVALGWIYDEFNDAPLLGSLLNPTMSDAARIISWSELGGAISTALAGSDTDEQHELTIRAHGISKAAQLLVRQYNWIATNVPYLGFKRQSDRLREFCKDRYPCSEAGLETVFVERSVEFLSPKGILSVVANQTWLFQPTSRRLREKLLDSTELAFVARLGARAFETISGDVVNVAMLIATHETPHTNHLLTYLDAQAIKTPSEKAQALALNKPTLHLQSNVRSNPSAIITDLQLSKTLLLADVAISASGLKTGDRDRFNRQYWEVALPNSAWDYYQVSSKSRAVFSGRNEIIFWESGCGQLASLAEEVRHLNHVAQNWRRGQVVWGRPGVAVSAVGKIACHLFHGDKFDSGVTVICPTDEAALAAMWEYCSSQEYEQALRSIDSKISITTATVLNVAFTESHWRQLGESKYPGGLPEPESDDPTQWIFHGRPEESDSPLQVAVVRLLGYFWPAECDKEMRLSKRSRELVKRCEELLPLADKDGIVCIPAVRGERSATDRLVDLLAKACGSAWSSANLNVLLKSVGHEGKSLESWLRDKFFEQHCELFHQRPFIWHIWDGLRDGFSVLVNYHKLDRKNLETLIYTYLGDWITRQKQDQANGAEGAEERITAAENLKRKLELILAGESPYDIFVRWKPLAEQPIGWEPDLNDGVRLNIRPFMSVPDVKARGAGVLRVKPKIDWKKDRGKDVESAPWYSLGPQYGGKEGDRINDHHLTLAEKRTAREAQKG